MDACNAWWVRPLFGREPVQVAQKNGPMRESAKRLPSRSDIPAHHVLIVLGPAPGRQGVPWKQGYDRSTVGREADWHRSTVSQLRRAECTNVAGTKVP